MSKLYVDGGPAPTAKGKVMLATTAYDSPDASYTCSIQASREALHQAGIASSYLLLSGNCHVDDARNSVVKEFLTTDCTDLVFIDADVSWEPADLLRLMAHDLDLVGGVYPKRDIERMSDMPCRVLEGVTEPDADGLLEVEGLPTGFMRIRRKVFEALIGQAKAYRTQNFDMMAILFERGAPPGMERLGGDLHFCHKWRQAGGRLFADTELRLGHTVKAVVHDSLGAALRRQSGTTLSTVCNRIRAGTDRLQDYAEAIDSVGNKYAAPSLILAPAVRMARSAQGHIIEAGSGLSTVLMAAALPAGKYVYCLEHDPVYAEITIRLARQAGVTNIGMCCAPLVDGWYDLSGFDLPERFGLGLLDGPPRVYGTRLKFLDVFANRCGSVLVDDADTAGFVAQVLDWCQAHQWSIDLHSGRLAVLRAVASQPQREAA